MNLYQKIKKAYENYTYSRERCVGCPSAIFLEDFYTSKDIQHLGGCSDVWHDYASDIIKTRTPHDWYRKNDLDTCPGCRLFSLKLSKETLRAVKI